jgi:hypothetical protein
MGFFGKLFRRGKNGTTAAVTQEAIAAKGPKQKRLTRREKKDLEKEAAKVAIKTKSEAVVKSETRTPSFTATNTTSVSGRGSSVTTEQKKSVLSPRANNDNGFDVMALPHPKSGPVDLDDADFDESDNENIDRRSRDGLSFQQLQRLNQQTSQQHPHHLYVMENATNKPSSHHLNGVEDLAYQSDSDFNLSTDNEDEEYNAMKSSLRVASQNNSALDSSGFSSPYHTDEEQAIFPALQNENEETDVGLPNPMPAVVMKKDRPAKPVSFETDDDMRAWTLSPSQSSQKENGISPRGHKAPAPEQPNRGFADFANFDAVAFSSTNATSSSTRRAVSARNLVEGTPDSRTARSSRHLSSSASQGQRDTSLSELLAQAKRTSSSRRGNSVNSAPAITAQYLRDFHGLRSSSQARSSSGTTSVSDIISSLEATNASRLRSSKNRASSHRSVGSRESGANASVRSASERIRERRRSERKRQSTGNDSDHSSENEEFLFDEVAGALGPRGVAADMESLSGRSKSSAGNKSHRSHRSSHNSTRPSRTKSSNESVNSRGSRESRYSHKSTRSYISQMSEQSRSVANDLLRLEMQLAMVGSQEGGEACVNGGGSIGGASRTSRTSRTSRRSVSTGITMRSKITVVAPPGKLGIILANKADSKGTVVSGVRTSSVLAEKVSPGDRIVAIDGEDVSRMTVSEITTIMARKSDFDRSLTVLTTPKRTEENAYAYRK